MSCGTNYVYFERVCVGVLLFWNLRRLRPLFFVDFIAIIFDFGIWGEDFIYKIAPYFNFHGRGEVKENPISAVSYFLRTMYERENSPASTKHTLPQDPPTHAG